MNTNQTPNTIAPVIATITVTTHAADIWSAYAAAEISRDSIRAEYDAANERHNRMCDAHGEQLDAGSISFDELKALCDIEDEILAIARNKRDTALAIADELDGVQA
jgi:hypothetical protein